MNKKVRLMIALLSAIVQGTWAESVTFNVCAWDATSEQVVTTSATQDATVLKGNHSDEWKGLENGYYVAKGEVDYKVLNIMGDSVHLIQADNCLLNCKRCGHRYCPRLRAEFR